ncbi:hypothetical protein GCM10010214_06530 [Streptomyces abikoensis]|nr:hypothetical protein GCM10010214_06530 [Streptomyces abikoensis]
MVTERQLTQPGYRQVRDIGAGRGGVDADAERLQRGDGVTGEAVGGGRGAGHDGPFGGCGGGVPGQAAEAAGAGAAAVTGAGCA